MNEIDALRRRVAAAERICYLVGISAAQRDTDLGKALTQAWMEWSKDYRRHVVEISDEEIEALAAQRDAITQRTLARLSAEQQHETERQRRLDLLECLYIAQGDQGAVDTETNPSGGLS